MTEQQIVHAVTTSPNDMAFLQQVISNLPDSLPTVVASLKADTTSARSYFLGAIAADWVTSSGTWQQRGDTIDAWKLHNLFLKSNYYSSYHKADELLSYIPDNLLKQLTAPSQFKRTRDVRNAATFDANAKQLKLDLFSFTVFKAYLATLKRGLTGKDASRYLEQVTDKWGDDPDHATKYQYRKLIWDNSPKKSIQLCKAIVDTRKLYIADIHLLPVLPITRAGSTDVLAYKSTNYCPAVSFNISWYQSTIHKYQLPVGPSIMTDLHSTIHRYITGVDKPTPINDRNHFEIVFDQLLVLNYMRTNHPIPGPYYDMAIDQLTAILIDPQYATWLINIKQLRAMLPMTIIDTLALV